MRALARLQRTLLAALLRCDVARVDALGTGALTSRLTSDCTLMGAVVTSNLNTFVQQLIALVGALIYMALVDLRLTAACAALMLSNPILGRVFGRAFAAIAKRAQDRRAATNQRANEAIANLRYVRASAAEPFEKQRYDEANHARVAVDLRSKALASLMMPIMSIFGTVATVVPLIYGGYRLRGGAVTAGELAAFCAYTAQVERAGVTIAWEPVQGRARALLRLHGPALRRRLLNNVPGGEREPV